MSRFHGGVGGSAAGGPATRTYSIRSMTSFPKLNPLAGMLSLKSSEVARHPTLEDLENEEQDPTFTPFISASKFTMFTFTFSFFEMALVAFERKMAFKKINKIASQSTKNLSQPDHTEKHFYECTRLLILISPFLFAFNLCTGF